MCVRRIDERASFEMQSLCGYDKRVCVGTTLSVDIFESSRLNATFLAR